MNAKMISSSNDQDSSFSLFNHKLKLFVASCVFLSVLAVYNTHIQTNWSKEAIAVTGTFKRLDELAGTTKQSKKIVIAKKVAAPVQKRIVVKKIEAKKAVAVVAKKPVNKMLEHKLEPAVLEDLNLNATMAYNATQNFHFTKGITGSLSTNAGIIASLSLNLPNGKSLNISTQEEMSGNVFQYYDYSSDETYSAMLYKISNTSYMVTLTNHPGLEGTKIQFDANKADIPVNNFESNNQLAENTEENYYNNDNYNYDQNANAEFADNNIRRIQDNSELPSENNIEDQNRGKIDFQL